MQNGAMASHVHLNPPPKKKNSAAYMRQWIGPAFRRQAII